VEKTRVDKSQVRLAECEVGDETGIVSLRARDDQISLLQEISSREGAVVLRNCSIELFQGKFIRLAVNKWGKVVPFPDGISSTPTLPTMMNDTLQLSIVDVSDVVGDEWLEPSLHSASRQSTDSRSSSNRGFRNRHHSQNSNQRGSGRGGHDRRTFRQGEVYNPNMMHGHAPMNPNMMPGMNFYSQHVYPGSINMPPYAFRHGHESMHHYDQHTQQEEYIRFQEYTMRMQMESMRLSYQHQQHQEQSSIHGSPPQPQGRHAPREDQYTIHSPALSPSVVPMVQVSPDQSAISTMNDTLSPAAGGDNENWSIPYEAESPMMNPHAAVFSSSLNYSMPSES
jgi:replication factor A1